jgi:hypothetical protein
MSLRTISSDMSLMGPYYKEVIIVHITDYRIAIHSSSDHARFVGIIFLIGDDLSIQPTIPLHLPQRTSVLETLILNSINLEVFQLLQVHFSFHCNCCFQYIMSNMTYYLMQFNFTVMLRLIYTTINRNIT